jgi:D-amino-acid dehydrogenase
MRGMRIVVLGAGVIGTATAYSLAEAGHQVSVIDRAAAAGEGTSRANGAILHPSSVGPWSSPGTPRKVLAWMGDPAAPFLLRPSALPHMWRWGIDFVRNCTPARHAANETANIALAVETLAALAAIRARTGITWHRRPAGVLQLVADDAGLRRAEARAATLRQAGLDARVLDRAGVAAIDPSLARLGNRIAGALHTQQDEVANAREFCVALAAWSAAHQGVAYRFGTTVRRLEVVGGRVAGVQTDAGAVPADAVVVALGPHSAKLLRGHGIRLPIHPVKGVSITWPRAAWPNAPQVALLDDVRHFAFVPLAEHVRIVGSAEIAGFDTTPDPARVRAIVDRVAELFPEVPIDDARGEMWAGLRPMTPSGTPIIGPAPRIAGLWLNTGHGHTGWTQSAGSAARLAGVIGRA